MSLTSWDEGGVVSGGDADSFCARPSGKIAEGDQHDVGRFLNRALGLAPEHQNR